MVKIVTTAGAITVLMVATASAQTLTEAQVLEAIALGQSTKKDIALKKVSAGYDFALRGPFARVVRLAADAANRQKSIVPANIPAAVLEPTMTFGPEIERIDEDASAAAAGYSPPRTRS